MFIRNLINKYKHITAVIVVAVLVADASVFIVITQSSAKLGVTAQNADNKNTPTPTPTLEIIFPSVFRDEKTGLSISIQLTEGQADTGQFDLFVPDKGYYRGVIPLDRSGKQIIHPRGTVTAKFTPLNDESPTDVTVRMEGDINTDHKTANINIWVSDTKYHLQTASVDESAAVNASKQAVSNITTKNWPALYSQLSKDIKATTTQTQFVNLMTGSTSPKIISAELAGEGQMKEMTGYTYFSQPITLTVKEPDDTTSTYKNNQYFVLENGEWRLLTTDTPVRE